MANYSAPSYSQHFTFAHYATRPDGPVRRLPQGFAQLLAAGTTLQLEVTSPGLAAIVGKTQKSELLGLSAALPGAFTGKSTKLDAAGLIPGHLQTKAFQLLSFAFSLLFSGFLDAMPYAPRSMHTVLSLPRRSPTDEAGSSSLSFSLNPPEAEVLKFTL